jgi:hypothetical protein
MRSITTSDITNNYKSEDFNIVMHHLTKEMNCMQEEVLRSVLRQILGREPEFEDAKLLTIIRYPGDLMDYSLAYDGHEIGRVVFENTFENQTAKWTVTFKPL